MDKQIKQSDPVKSEWSDLCRGCLSGDRNLTPLKINMELFSYLAGQSPVLWDPDYLSNTLLCWECTAVLRRIHAFQTRVRNAQYILQGSLYQLNDSNLKSLSALSISPTRIINNPESMEPSFTNEKETPVLYNSITTNTLKCDQICPKYSLSNKLKQYDTSIETHQQASDIEAQKRNFNIEVEVEGTDITCKEEIFDVDVQNSEFSDTELAIEDITEKCKVKTEQKKRGCFQKYSKKADIAANENIHSKKFDGCYTKVSLSENEIEKMIQKDNRNRKQFGNKCRQCKMGFKMPVDYKRHKTFRHKPDADSDGSYKCLECFASVATRDDLLAHWNVHNYAFKCKFCGLMFGHRFQMQTHLEVTHSKVYTCRECQAVFYSGKDFSSHYKNLHKHFICDECGHRSSSKTIILKHIRRCHKTMIQCEKCSRTYSNYNALMKHIGRVHPSVPANRETAYCVECDKQYDSVHRYKAHLKTALVHNGKPKKKRIPCPACGKIFARTSTLNNHYSLYHAGKAKFNCDICGKCLVTGYSLRKHRMRVHDKIPFPKTKMCDLCGRAFTTNRILANHRRTHTGERPFACSLCPSAFAQKTALKSHVRTQHNKLHLDRIND